MSYFHSPYSLKKNELKSKSKPLYQCPNINVLINIKKNVLSKAHKSDDEKFANMLKIYASK